MSAMLEITQRYSVEASTIAERLESAAGLATWPSPPRNQGDALRIAADIEMAARQAVEAGTRLAQIAEGFRALGQSSSFDSDSSASPGPRRAEGATSRRGQHR